MSLLLQSLEEKIVVLIDLIQKLKQENGQLKQEVAGFIEKNQGLEQQVQLLEESMLKESNHLHEQLQKEKELTKTVVDDLIKNIDAIVENEKQLL